MDSSRLLGGLGELGIRAEGSFSAPILLPAALIFFFRFACQKC
jgi:hypothetical protein